MKGVESLELIMKLFLVIVVTAIHVLFSAGCSPTKDTHSARPEMSRCQEELSTIPEVAAASMKARHKRAEEREESLEGMEIALTMNRMVLSTADPDRDQDDWCYTENNRDSFQKLLNALKTNNMPPTVDFLAGESLEQQLQEEW